MTPPRIPRPAHRLLELSDTLTPHLVAPPRPGQADTCWRCRSWNSQPDHDNCPNCALIETTLGRPALPVDLISLYRRPSPLRSYLTSYKGRPDGSEPQVPAFGEILQALVERFFNEHAEQLWRRAPFDCLVVVPSSQRRPPHPLEACLASLNLDIPLRALLRRAAGDMAHNQPCRDGFEIAENSKRQQVYLIDDVYTTGAHLNSAAAALRAAGHRVAGALAIARRVNPDVHPAIAAFWKRQAAQPFSWPAGPAIQERVDTHAE